MVILTPTEDIETLKAGREYVMEHVQAGAICIVQTPGLRSASTWQEFPQFDPGQDWNGRRVLICRPGGIGDLLFLSPVIRELRRRWPSIQIEVSVMPKFHPGAVLVEGIDVIHTYPMEIGEVREFDAMIWLENAIEFNPRAHTVPYVDLLLERFGLEVPDSEKELACTIPDEAVEWARRERAQTPRPLATVNIFSSNPNRSWPPRHYGKLIRLLTDAGWHVAILDSPGCVKVENGEHITNYSAQKISLAKSVAMVGESDVFIGPDSALLHFAGALDVPAIGLYGPFPWQMRTSYAKSIKGIQMKPPCAPCFYHGRMGHYPKTGADGKAAPCIDAKECVALAQIEPKRVYATAIDWSKKGRRHEIKV